MADSSKRDQIDFPSYYSYHHIYPNCEVEKLIPDSTVNSIDRKKIIEEYLNQPHIKKIIVDKGLWEKKEDHGRLIHASISWNPHNLVYGPAEKYRGYNPGNTIDRELLSKQSIEYQQAFNSFLQNKSLIEFGKLPTTNPVNFKQNPADGKYYAV